MTERPQFPRGCKPDSQPWKDYQRDMEAYLAEHRSDHLDGIPKTQPEPFAMNARMLSEPRKKRPAWSDDPEYYRAAKARQRLRDKEKPKPCCDCGTEPRLPRKSRCMFCNETQEDKMEEAKHKRKAQIKQGLTARKRGECLEVRP